MNQNGISMSVNTPEKIKELVTLRQEENALFNAEQQGIDVSASSILGLGGRMGWLILISIIVCIVGIANVMLMSVTERFREIATLKCLGALDGFILLTFVFEACMIGFAGGLVGGILGCIIGFGRMLYSFGPLLFSAIPFLDLFVWTSYSVLIGVVLAAIASIYPSLKAARLAPMEAMRIE
jgi:putative ABC transport system permease protein